MPEQVLKNKKTLFAFKFFDLFTGNKLVFYFGLNATLIPGLHCKRVLMPPLFTHVNTSPNQLNANDVNMKPLQKFG